MQRCAFTPYEGKKPYIFISYAHKDSDRVFPILEELDRRGYRVWYDDGIAPGSEWPENIAQHLDGCSLTLAFVSPASIASANCRREVTFALSKRKPFLGIMLEPTEMSLGMELQLSAQQCIMKYTYQDDGAFFNKVCSCPDLAPCLGQPKVVAPQPAVAPQPVAVAAPAPAPAAAPRKKKTPDKKLMGILAGAAGVLVVLAIVLIALLSGKDGPADGNLEDPTDNWEANALSFEQQTITAGDIANINQHSLLEELTFSGCTFESGVLSQLSALTNLKYVQFDDCVGVTDLKVFASLDALYELHVVGCDVTDEAFAPFCSTELYSLDLSDNPRLSDLSPFANCSDLRVLNISNTAVSSLDSLSNMTALEVINGSYSQIRNIDQLAGISTLQTLCFAGCQLTDIAGTFSCLRLAKLDLADNDLSGLDAFENCAVLEYVNLSYNDLLSAYPLSKSAEKLWYLNLSGNDMLNANDVEFLLGATKMEELYLDDIMLLNLDMLSNMTKLRALRASSCRLSDIGGLANTVSQLDLLYLFDNAIEDISVLSGLSSESMVLDLSNNMWLQDVSALSTACYYRVLNLVNDELDFSTVSKDLQCENILLMYQDGMETSDWVQENSARYCYIVCCPLEKIVAMEDALVAAFASVTNSEDDYFAALRSLYQGMHYFEDEL